MSDSPEKETLTLQFHQEIPVRRMASLLEGKRKRIRDDILQLVQHIGFLVPPRTGATGPGQFDPAILEKALGRLGDDAFAQLVIQIVRDEAPPK